MHDIKSIQRSIQNPIRANRTLNLIGRNWFGYRHINLHSMVVLPAFLSLFFRVHITAGSIFRYVEFVLPI